MLTSTIGGYNTKELNNTRRKEKGDREPHKIQMYASRHHMRKESFAHKYYKTQSTDNQDTTRTRVKSTASRSKDKPETRLLCH